MFKSPDAVLPGSCQLWLPRSLGLIKAFAFLVTLALCKSQESPSTGSGEQVDVTLAEIARKGSTARDTHEGGPKLPQTEVRRVGLK